jgi:hypothetical protein
MNNHTYEYNNIYINLMKIFILKLISHGLVYFTEVDEKTSVSVNERQSISSCPLVYKSFSKTLKSLTYIKAWVFSHRR